MRAPGARLPRHAGPPPRRRPWHLRGLGGTLYALLLAVPLLLAQAPAASAALDLTAREKAWLAAHPVIRLGVDPDFAPYAFIDAQGRPTGIASELTALVGERLGVRLELVPGLTWPQILEAARERRIDVITTATYRPEREAYLNFTRPYLITPLVVMTRVETPPLRDLAQLNRLRVALVKDYASTRTALERFPGIDALLVANPLEGLYAVSEGRAEAYIGVLGINTFLASRHGISNLRVNAGFDMMNNQSYGVRKDWPELVPLLEKAINSIPAEQQQAIFARWISVPVADVILPAVNLDPKVRALVEAVPPATEQKPLALVAVIPRDSPPEYQLDDAGLPSGFAIEVMALIAQRAGLDLAYRVEDSWDKTIQSLREGRADLIPNFGITEERRREFGFTSPFETFRISLFVRDDTHDIRGLNDLAGRRVAVVRANAAETILKARAEIRLESYADFPDALFALLSGNVDALAYPEPWTWKRARRARVADQIKVVGEPLAELKRGLAVQASRQELLERIERAVQYVLTTPEYREIYARWLGEAEPYWTPARLLWASGLVLALTILAMAGWRYQSTARAYRALKSSQEEQQRIEARRQTIFETASVSLWEEDITEVRRLIESRRAEVVAGWDKYCDAHPELVTQCARALRVLDVNEASLRVYEASSKQELLGSIDRFFSEDSLDVFKQELVAIAEGRRHFSAETVNRTLRGQDINILLSLSIPPADSPSQRMVAAVLDISARKRVEEKLVASERRLSDLFQHAHDMILIVEPGSGRILDANRRVSELLGYTNEELLDKTVFDLGPPGMRYQSEQAMHQLATEGQAVFERTLQNKEGALIFAELSARIIEVDGRQVIEGFARDITERKRAEEERAEIFRELEQRNREMESFVYTISHDLKSPLITISGFTRMLAKDVERGDKQSGRESLEEIRKASDGMQQLIEDLLLYSRTGQIPGEPEEVDLQALLADVQKRCASHIERVHATIRVATPLPRLHVDRVRFTQLLQNLLDNGVKFHRPGVAPVVEIGAERKSGEIRLYVRDNGIGIEKRYQDKIFGLFQRLDTDREGTGVGLTIARRIVEQHGGRLWVESEPGKGSIFWISLPDSVIVSDGARHSARENQSPR